MRNVLADFRGFVKATPHVVQMRTSWPSSSGLRQDDNSSMYAATGLLYRTMKVFFCKPRIFIHILHIQQKQKEWEKSEKMNSASHFENY